MLETRSFIERSIPTMIHLQLVEGLHVVAGTNRQNLRQFERNKLSELMKYQLDNEGKETFTSKLKYRLREFCME